MTNFQTEDDVHATVEIVVDKKMAVLRIDKAIAEQLLERSRSEIQKWIEDGYVEIDGKTASKKCKLHVGDKIRVKLPAPKSGVLIPEDVDFEILFEDETVCVLNKPAGLVVHPAPGNETGTLVHGLLYRKIVTLSENERPGIVHRLDKNTSGVMVVAKTEVAKTSLVAQFKKHSIGRKYQAIVVGNPVLNFSIKTLHGRHPVHRKKFSGKVAEGKEAITYIRVLKEFQDASLCECTLETGRTHQIRVHLSEHGFPILGDPVYGKTPKTLVLKEAHQLLGRQALHAQYLSFTHPETGQQVEFKSALPGDIEKAMKSLQ